MFLYFIIYILSMYIADTVHSHNQDRSYAHSINWCIAFTFAVLKCKEFYWSLSITKHHYLNNKIHFHNSVKFLFVLQQGLIGHVFLLLCTLASKRWGMWCLQPLRVSLHTSLWCVPAFSFALHQRSTPWRWCSINIVFDHSILWPVWLFYPIYFLFNTFSTSNFLEQTHGLYIIEFIKTNKELIIPGDQPSKIRINLQIWTTGCWPNISALPGKCRICLSPLGSKLTPSLSTPSIPLQDLCSFISKRSWCSVK